MNRERKVSLSLYLVGGADKPGFLICPGGGYENCEESEGKPIAEAYNKKGYDAFILRYSVGAHRGWPEPLDDFDAAMAYLSAHRQELSIDAGHIVAVGFSAGGHVVTAAASIAKNKPFAAIACYGLSARETLAFCLPQAPDTSELVNADTVPCFLASSRNDWIVPNVNATRLIEAFRKNDVDYEAHIYGYAMHGFRLGAETGASGPLFCSRVGDWFEDSLAWVDELVSGRYVSIKDSAEYQDAHATRMSTKNSTAMIFANPEAESLIRRKFPVEYLIYIAAKKNIGAFLMTVSLRNLYDLMKVGEKTIGKMDEALSCFPVRQNP